jgi:hypothetical protein
LGMVTRDVFCRCRWIRLKHDVTAFRIQPYPY